MAKQQVIAILEKLINSRSTSREQKTVLREAVRTVRKERRRQPAGFWLYVIYIKIDMK